jgi:hypothetical protein
MVAKLTAVLFAGFGTNRHRCDEAMKTADREPKSLGQNSQQPSTWRGSSAQILLNQVGCEARKTPADGGVFFLDFPFYRTLPVSTTYRALRLLAVVAQTKQEYSGQTIDNESKADLRTL